MESADGFEVEARSLHIAAAPGSLARVKVENGRNVLVSAVRGALRVTNAGGVLVARMETGNSRVFEPQAAGAVAPTRRRAVVCAERAAVPAGGADHQYRAGIAG